MRQPDLRGVGPRYNFLINPLNSSGNPTKLIYLGGTRGDNTFDLGEVIQRIITDQTGPAPLAEAMYKGGAKPVFVMPQLDASIGLVKELTLSGVFSEVGGGKAITFSNTPSEVDRARIYSFVSIPQRTTYEGDKPFEDEDTIFLTAVRPVLQQMTLGSAITDTEDGGKPYQLRLEAMTALTWQDKATAVPDDINVGWIGQYTAIQSVLDLGLQFPANLAALNTAINAPLVPA
ncbi:MAG: hypothetical protein RhofKO_25920 [Rhodothermales bacterium]